jgi:hypothetical protein
MGQPTVTGRNWEERSSSPLEEIGLFVTSQEFPTTPKRSFRSGANALRVTPPKIDLRPPQISPFFSDSGHSFDPEPTPFIFLSVLRTNLSRGESLHQTFIGVWLIGDISVGRF